MVGASNKDHIKNNHIKCILTMNGKSLKDLEHTSKDIPYHLSINIKDSNS